MKRPIPWSLILFAALWIAAVGSGMAVVLDFATAPGGPGLAPPTWPRETHLVPSPGLPTLVMIGHPRCPCTRASLGELARLMARLRGRLTAHVLFIQPAGADEGWSRTDIVSSAAKILGVQVLVDLEGQEARCFHVATSGHTLLYDAEGKLRFSGGITTARGHAGNSGGRSALIALVEEGTSSQATSAVFGCPLHDATPAAEEVRTP